MDEAYHEPQVPRSVRNPMIFMFATSSYVSLTAAVSYTAVFTIHFVLYSCSFKSQFLSTPHHQ